VTTDSVGRSADALSRLRRVIVTGATGFLGRHLARHLRSAGTEVLTLSRTLGFDLLTDELPMRGVNHVFHLAAQTGVVEAWDNPAEFFNINTQGTVRVLDQCRRHTCSLTYLSAYVYGPPLRLPTTESDPVRADNPYAFSKFMAEEACRFFHTTFDVPITILRPFNIYGPGQSERFLIPRIVAQIADADCQEIAVMDLAPRRDYLFVSDAVAAIVASLTSPPGSLFNIGSGMSYSVEEVIKIACRSAGVVKPYRATAGVVRRNEIDDVVADISALQGETGWLPRISLGEGLRRLFERNYENDRHRLSSI
jgi:nucleoside-diphosphate-sugar epimerase